MRLLLVLALACLSLPAADLDPSILTYKIPADLKWSGTPGRFQQAVLFGDPSKSGLYIVLAKWPPGTGSRPHFHPNDRYITVISGTWWVGTGAEYDTQALVPMKPGSFIRHLAGGVHYDTAKDEEVILQIVGMGPDTSTRAEDK